MRSLLIGLMVMCGGLGGAVASAEARTLYAYAAGTSTAATCPKASTTSAQCSLGTALTDAAAGDTVMLATPGASANYVGNWSVGTTGTSSSKPVTIDGGDVSGATLSGNNGNAAGCSTAACNGPVLHVSNNMFLMIENLTIEDGNNSATTDGGAIENIAGGNVTITDATFSENAAGVSGDGGAIGNGDGSGASGTVTITGSTFTENLAYEGAAVANGVETGGGTATITDSTFTGNEGRDGGAIANGIEDGAGTATIADSTFTNNLAADGGAIDTGDEDGNAAATIENSTFTGNGGGATAGRSTTPTTAGRAPRSSSTRRSAIVRPPMAARSTRATTRQREFGALRFDARVRRRERRHGRGKLGDGGGVPGRHRVCRRLPTGWQ